MTDKSKLILDLTKAYNDNRYSDYRESLKAVLDMLESAEGEYIKKEDALNAIRKSAHYGRTQKIYVCHREVVDSIDELPTYSFPDREKGEWLPCSERLPEEDKEVLIFTKDKEINKAYHTLKEWSDTQWEWFVFGTLGYSLTYSDNEVLAWQPLPKPYETEREDKE